MLSARLDVMSCNVPMVSFMQCVWFHTYIGCDVISQVGLITQIHWYHVRYSRCVVIHSAGEMSYTLSIMSKTLQVSCHSYSGCDVTSVVYVMSHTVGSVFRNIVDVIEIPEGNRPG